MSTREMTVRVERTWARDAAAFALVLARQDPTWGSETFELAGGNVVLCGPGLYVNRALAVGFDEPLTDDDLDLLEHRSAAVGVPAAIEILSVTHPGTIEAITGRGFVPSPVTTTALLFDGDDRPRDAWSTIDVRPVEANTLAAWQEVSALGWGHSTTSARRAADAFARAAQVIDGDGMVIACDTFDGRPLGCASLTMNDGVATLGGMSTIPSERGRGVQSALIEHRLAVARATGCDVVVSSAATGSTSERNLTRHGFRPLHTKACFTLNESQ